jgi:FixJ family two-component response regulator
MLEFDGRDLPSALGRTPDPLPVLFLTSQVDTASTVRAMQRGAEDVLEKTTEKGILLDAVHRALARDQQAREERRERQALRRRFKTLSPREREVLGHLLGGRLNKQIASDMGIHERTVKVHRKSVMAKLNIRSVAALVRLSQEAGVSTRPTFTRGNGLRGSRLARVPSQTLDEPRSVELPLATVSDRAVPDGRERLFWGRALGRGASALMGLC